MHLTKTCIYEGDIKSSISIQSIRARNNDSKNIQKKYRAAVENLIKDILINNSKIVSIVIFRILNNDFFWSKFRNAFSYLLAFLKPNIINGFKLINIFQSIFYNSPLSLKFSLYAKLLNIYFGPL